MQIHIQLCECKYNTNRMDPLENRKSINRLTITRRTVAGPGWPRVENSKPGPSAELRGENGSRAQQSEHERDDDEHGGTVERGRKIEKERAREGEGERER